LTQTFSLSYDSLWQQKWGKTIGGQTLITTGLNLDGRSFPQETRSITGSRTVLLPLASLVDFAGAPCLRHLMKWEIPDYWLQQQ
jgi:hypothetical protein